MLFRSVQHQMTLKFAQESGMNIEYSKRYIYSLIYSCRQQCILVDVSLKTIGCTKKRHKYLSIFKKRLVSLSSVRLSCVPLSTCRTPFHPKLSSPCSPRDTCSLQTNGQSHSLGIRTYPSIFRLYLFANPCCC